MAERVLVPFSGPGEGIEQLSWGQRNMWMAIEREGKPVLLGGAVPLPAGSTLDGIVRQLSFVLGRHPALRTKLVFGPDNSGPGREVRQRLFSSGELALAVVDCAGREPQAVAREVEQDYARHEFDYETEWPVRAAVICQDGTPVWFVAIYLHVQLDGLGLQLLIDDLADLDAPPDPDVLGPLEQARWQQTPAAARQSEAALRLWERALRTVPLQRFEQRYPTAEPAFPQLVLTSPALRLALRRLSAELALDSSPILLGLLAVAVGRDGQPGPFLASLAVSNRFRPGLARSVSMLAQVSPCVIDVADCTLAEVFGRTRRATVAAYKYGYYDPVARLRLSDQVAAERGQKVDLSCYFSDRRLDRDPLGQQPPTEQQVLAALPGSTVEWTEQLEGLAEKLYFTVADAPDTPDAVQLRLTADARYFSREDMERLLRSIETIAVDAVRDPATSTGVSSIPVPA